MTESQTAREERVCQHLAEARMRIESDIAHTSDPAMKRIAADAAAIVTLTIASELLPTPAQAHVQAVIDLHNRVWSTDETPRHATPRKPIGGRLFQRFTFFLRHTDDRRRPPNTTYSLPPTPLSK